MHISATSLRHYFHNQKQRVNYLSCPLSKKGRAISRICLLAHVKRGDTLYMRESRHLHRFTSVYISLEHLIRTPVWELDISRLVKCMRIKLIFTITNRVKLRYKQNNSWTYLMCLCISKTMRLKRLTSGVIQLHLPQKQRHQEISSHAVSRQWVSEPSNLEYQRRLASDVSILQNVPFAQHTYSNFFPTLLYTLMWLTADQKSAFTRDELRRKVCLINWKSTQSGNKRPARGFTHFFIAFLGVWV